MDASSMPHLNEASWAFSQAAASALEQLHGQVRESQAEVASLQQDNEALRMELARKTEHLQHEQTKQSLKHKEAIMDVERLQDLVTELREALASAARRNEALAKDNDATSDELRQLKVRSEEWKTELLEQRRLAEDAERRAAEASAQALELNSRVKEEQMRAAKAGHAARERAEAAERLKALQSETAAEAKEASLRADAAQEAARVSEAAAETARISRADAEERAREAEAGAKASEEAVGRLQAQLRAAEEARQRAESQLAAVQGRMAERLRAQEERARQQAAGAVEAAREERDREAEAAEEARGAEARTRMLLREFQTEVEELRRAAERQAADLAAAQEASEEARQRAASAEAAAQREAALRSDAEAALRRSEASLEEVTGMNQELTSKLLKAEAAAAERGGCDSRTRRRSVGPDPRLPAGEARKSSAVARSQARPSGPYSISPPSRLPEGQPLPLWSLPKAVRRSCPTRGASASPELPHRWKPPPTRAADEDGGAGSLKWEAGDAGDNKWEQVRDVLEGLEEELREMDLRHDELLRQSQDDRASGDPQSAARLATRMRKELAAMQRKGQQIASLRRQAEALRPPWGSPP